MKTRFKDAGLEYLKQLELKPSRNTWTIIDEISRRFGKEKGDQFATLINERADRNSFIEEQDYKEADRRFYNTKNEDFALGLYLTGAVDGDIIRKACNWIVEHRDFFGSSILEIGCDIGLISCFLAKTFPNSTITAIDRCENGLAIGQKLAERFGLSNIRFVCTDANELMETFDTVFSMRVMHENHNSLEDTTLLFKQTARVFQEGTNAYAQTLSKLVSDEGNVVSIERCGKNPLLLGWLWALRDNGLLFVPELYSELKCQEFGRESTFEVGVCVKEPTSDISEDDIYNVFCEMFIGEFDPLSPQFDGWVAAVMLQNSFGDLVEGYEAYDPKQSNWKFSHNSLWTNPKDSTSVLGYDVKIDEGLRKLYNVDISIKDDWIKRNRDFNRALVENGYIVKKIELKDGNIISGSIVRREDLMD